MNLHVPPGIPAPPLLGRLPLARVIPQDVHAVFDYAAAAAVLATAFSSRSSRARTVSVTLGVGGLVVSALTNYRLSALKLIPIRAHEVIDYLWGAAAIAAPFALGYRRGAPTAAGVQLLAGAGNIASSLFTDYRAARAPESARARSHAVALPAACSSGSRR